MQQVWKKHPLAFAPQLQAYLEFALETLSDSRPETVFSEPLCR